MKREPDAKRWGSSARRVTIELDKRQHGQREGKPFFEKYGKFIFLNEKRLEKLTKWFSKYGSMLLLISYFIPGFRHFTGYFSGISGIRFRVFCFFNHIGALLWVFTYVMIGHVFSEQFEKLIHLISKNSSRFVFVIAFALLIVYIFGKGSSQRVRGLNRFLGIILPKATHVSPVLTLIAVIGLAAVVLLGALFHIMRKEYREIIMNIVFFAFAVFIAIGRV